MQPDELKACQDAFESELRYNDNQKLKDGSYLNNHMQMLWTGWRLCWERHVLKPFHDVTDKNFHP